MIIYDWCRELLALSEQDWASYARSQDPLRGRVSAQEYLAFYRQAQACGRQQADALRQKWGGHTAREYAALLDVQVQDEPMPPGDGYITFACYYEPDRIVLYADNARDAQGLLEDGGLLPLTGAVQLPELVLAHELYHVVQARSSGLFPTQQHITLWKLGRFHRRSRLPSLEEVAAMGFAQALCGAQCCPFLFDVFLLLPRHPQRAKQLYQTLMRLHSENEGA